MGLLLALAAVSILAIALFALSNFSWRKYHRGELSGPAWVWPIVGSTLHCITDPYGYWLAQRAYGKISWNSLFGKFLVFVTDVASCRSILTQTGSHAFQMVVHPNSSIVLGEEHLAVMMDDTHKYFRGLTSSILTPARLAEVIPTQDRIMREHLKLWVDSTSKKNTTMLVRHGVRDMVMDQNQEVFLGGYLPAHLRQQFAQDWSNVNDGLLSFPLLIPGLGLWKARQSRFRLTNNIEDCFRRCRKDIDAGKDVHLCLMSHWIKHLTKTGEILETNEDEMTHSILDFMFASQDASISALTWTVALMEAYPDIFERVRAEQRALRPNNETITHDLMMQMKFTRQVVSEILRFRPPAIFVPHLAHADVQLPTYKVPKGALVFVDVFAACREGYSDPESFNPDRFGPELNEGEKYRKNWLVFGTGLHVCAGRHYAFNQITVWLALLATNVNFTRVPPKEPGHVYQFAPTITPADHVIASFTSITA